MPAHVSTKPISKKPVPIIHLNWSELKGVNGRIAVYITNAVSTMWCVYLFAGIALISLPSALYSGISTTISWIAQIFLQLVLLSVIMVGQKIAAKASDRRAVQTFKDAEAILKIQNELHEQLKLNNDLTQKLHEFIILDSNGRKKKTKL